MYQLFTAQGVAGNSPIVGEPSVRGRLVFQVRGTHTGLALRAAARIAGEGGAIDTVLPVRNEVTGATIAAGTSIAANGIYSVDVSGLDVQLQITAITTGSATVTGNTYGE